VYSLFRWLLSFKSQREHSPPEGAMKIEAKYHRMAEASLRAWHTRLAAIPGGNELAHFHQEEVLRELERQKGLPDGAEFASEFDPPCYIWKSSADTWVRYIIKDQTFGPFVLSRKIVVIRITQTRSG
jgi:hypothetical protein